MSKSLKSPIDVFLNLDCQLGLLKSHIRGLGIEGVRSPGEMWGKIISQLDIIRDNTRLSWEIIGRIIPFKLPITQPLTASSESRVLNMQIKNSCAAVPLKYKQIRHLSDPKLQWLILTQTLSHYKDWSCLTFCDICKILPGRSLVSSEGLSKHYLRSKDIKMRGQETGGEEREGSSSRILFVFGRFFVRVDH